jgi:hypothetical protein
MKNDGFIPAHDKKAPDSTEDGTPGFTPFGLDNVREILDDPSIMDAFLQHPA